MTSVGIYGDIQPRPLENPSGSGNISPYIPPLVIIHTQSLASNLVTAGFNHIFLGLSSFQKSSIKVSFVLYSTQYFEHQIEQNLFVSFCIIVIVYLAIETVGAIQSICKHSQFKSDSFHEENSIKCYPGVYDCSEVFLVNHISWFPNHILPK